MQAIGQCGGKGVSLQQVYDVLASNTIVTPYHKEPWSPGLQLRYECQIRRVLTDLCREGKVSRVGRGIYSLP